MDKRHRYLVRYPIFFAILSLCLMGTLSKRGLLDYRRMVDKNREISQRIEELGRQKAALVNQLDSLKVSREEQERWIRSVLGYVKKDETVIEFD